MTNGENGRLFEGSAFERPAVLLAWAGHFATGSAGYVEVQLAGMHGSHRGAVNDTHDHAHDEAEDDDAVEGALDSTNLASAALDVAYDPPGGRDRFRVFWRSQALYLTRDGDARTHRLGAFSYVDAWLSGAWGLGARFDALGETRDALELGETTFGAAPYLTWWQSEFVRLRLQYRAEGADAEALEHVVALQVVGAVGPHRHERY